MKKPDHYEGVDIDTIELAKQWLSSEERVGAYKFLILKYIQRMEKKGSPELDSEKLLDYAEELHKVQVERSILYREQI